MNYHPDDYDELFNKHDGCTGRINDMLVTLQDEAYALGRKRGKAEAEATAPKTEAKPLTDEQIAEGRYRMWAAEPDDAPEAWSFMRGARWAEKHFGIGATTGKEPGNV